MAPVTQGFALGWYEAGRWPERGEGQTHVYAIFNGSGLRVDWETHLTESGTFSRPYGTEVKFQLANPGLKSQNCTNAARFAGSWAILKKSLRDSNLQ